MIELTPDECRVLGVLIEKAQTTPAQYPLTLNALQAGANQKSNRDPILAMSEEQVLEALDSLRGKALVREVMLSGSRVEKFRHTAREGLEVSTAELVILAELLLRGPQTAGELRSRASRMHPLESMEVVTNVLEHLSERPEPYVRRLSPAPGSRAARFAQLLCPDLHALEASPAASGAAPAVGETGEASLARRVEALEAEVKEVRKAIERLEAVLGRA
ncbi:MAG: YceH family protein [Planctomycetota bacterium]|nr:YceH family protein [Planctomycetota bacterium]